MTDQYDPWGETDPWVYAGTGRIEPVQDFMSTQVVESDFFWGVFLAPATHEAPLLKPGRHRAPRKKWRR